MNEIKCPKCGTVFQIDETEYQSILKQVRDQEFEKEIHLHEKQYQLDKENALKIKESSLKESFQKDLSQKELEIVELKKQIEVQESKHELDKQKSLAEKDQKISEMELKEKSLKEDYESKLKNKDEQNCLLQGF